MGLFTRFRTPSGSHPQPNGRSTTPGPSSEPPAATPSRPSTSLGRQSSYFGYENDDAPTPRPKEKEKRGFGWKGKAKADLGGRPYEEQHHPEHAPATGAAGEVADRRNGEKRITAIFTPHPNTEPHRSGPRSSTPSAGYSDHLRRSSPTSPISPRSDRTVQNGPSSVERAKARTMSDEFMKDGGALGRLTFERDKPRPEAERKKRDVPSWLAGSGSEEEFVLLDRGQVGEHPASSGIMPPSASAPAGFYGITQPSQPQHPVEHRFPPVPIRKSSANPLPPPISRSITDDGHSGSAISDGEDEGPAPTGKEGAGKKGRFWAGKVRRASKAGDLEHHATASRPTSPTPTPRKAHPPPTAWTQPDPDTSPTPRKSSLPPVPASKSTNTSAAASPIVPDQPLSTVRPPNPHANIRRPSSSFFSNPFARTTSRSSIFTDIDSPIVDDGSFQLKGFRHVSGISQIDSPSQANGTSSVLGLADRSLSTSPSALEKDNPLEEKWDLPPPTRPIISRPGSSASLRTLDSAHDSPKVSVAAFKKGIRRPSEGPGSAIEGSKSALDDDDDVPLGVLNRGFARAKSSLSLSDQAQPSVDVPRISPSVGHSPITSGSTQKLTPSPRVAQISQPPSREPSPAPQRALSPAQNGRPVGQGHQRNGGGSGGFVVRSAQSTRSSASVDSRAGGHASPGGGPSRSTSPLMPERGREEIILSPIEVDRPLPGATFGLKVNGGQAVEKPIPTPTPSQAPSGMVERNINLPPISPSIPTQPKPLKAKPSIETDLSKLVLPPRPSELADDQPVPPARPAMRSRTSSGQHSPLALPTDISRRISNFLAPSLSSSSTAKNETEDGFDPALVVQSMAILSDPPASPPKSSARPSLQARLGQVAGTAAGSAKPVVGRIDTDLPPPASGVKGNGVWSPADSDTTTTPIVDSSFRTTGKAKADRPKRGRGRIISASGNKKAWSSSESSEEESEKEKEVEKEEAPMSSFRKPIGPRSPPRTTRAITPVPAPTAPAKAADTSDDADSSSSEEETLAVIRAKASKSTLNLGTYSSGPISGSGPIQRGFRSPSSPNLYLSPPGKSIFLPSPPRVGTSTRLPPVSSSPRTTPAELQRSPPKPNSHLPKKTLSPPSSSTYNLPNSSSSCALGPRRSPLSQSLSSTQLNADSTSPPRSTGRVSLASTQPPSASPASSQSGLTGDSVLQPVTPRESSVGAKPRVRIQESSGRKEGHARVESRDSQPSNGYNSGHISSSNSMASMSPSIEERQRRFSQTSMPTPAPQLQAMGGQAQQGYPANMDPAAIRNMMKQQWQAQFIAAAYQAAEEQWERASTAGGMAGSESGQSAYSAFPAPSAGHMGMGMPPMPFGYGYPPAMGMGMPPGFIPQPQYPMGGYPGFPHPNVPAAGQQAGMYSYAPGTQSVYGADFGPAVPQQQQFQQPYLQYQQYLQQQQQQQQFQQGYSPQYVSSPLSHNPHQPLPDTAESVAGPIRQRPRTGSRAMSAHLSGIDEGGAGGGRGGGHNQPRVQNRASSYNIGSSAAAVRPGMPSSASASGLSLMAGGPPPPPTSWRRSTSEWGGDAPVANVSVDKRKSRGGFAS